jgi:hypothetical protein
LTGGEARDTPLFETLLDLGPDITPRAAVGDKGYDAKEPSGRPYRGICPAIPYRTTTKDKPTFYSLWRKNSVAGQSQHKLSNTIHMLPT